MEDCPWSIKVSITASHDVPFPSSPVIPVWSHLHYHTAADISSTNRDARRHWCYMWMCPDTFPLDPKPSSSVPRRDVRNTTPLPSHFGLLCSRIQQPILSAITRQIWFSGRRRLSVVSSGPENKRRREMWDVVNRREVPSLDRPKSDLDASQ